MIEESQKTVSAGAVTATNVKSQSKLSGLFKFFKIAKKSSQTNNNKEPTTNKTSTIIEEIKMEFSSSGGDEEDGRGSSSLNESLDTYSPASSPKEVANKKRQNLSVVESTSFHDTTNNKSDDEDADDDEINERSILNKETSKKFSTMRENVKLESINLFKYNTASRVVDAKAAILKPKKLFSSSINSVNNNNNNNNNNVTNTLSSFKTNGTPRLNDNRKRDNINNNNNELPEDCSQGN